MDDAYIHVKCKCGRTLRGLKEYLKKGISCPDCGAFVKAHPRDYIKAQNETQELPKQEIENKPSPGIPPTDKCPACNAVVIIDYRKKYLACCHRCSKLFIRSQKPDPEEATDDGSALTTNSAQTEEKQEKNTVSDSTVTDVLNDEAKIAANEAGNIDTSANSALTEQQPRSKERKSISNTQEKQAQSKTETPIVPPSEKQLKLLRFLGIGGTTESSNEMSSIISTITSLVEDAIREYNISFHLFPVDEKTEIIYSIIKSPFFPGIYFGDRDIKYEELQPIIDDTVRDVELRKAMKVYIPDESFILAQKYISGFCDYVFNAPVDPDLLRELTLKSFVRGFGPKLQPFSNVLYDNRAATRNISEQEKHNYRLFFKKKTTTNSYLEALLNEYGFKRPVKEPESSLGCLIYFCPLFLPMLLYFAL